MIFREESNDDVVDDDEEEDPGAQNLKGCICSNNGSPFVLIFDIEVIFEYVYLV